MEEMKLCPVCGGKVIGRSDKKYCSDGCRILAANRRGNEARKRLRENDAVYSINRDLKALDGRRGGRYIKFIALITRFCKILYKFEH
ncbi:MAG: hypothetical protein IJ383_02880 [Bacteroidales bacterium]|nr:hypothetical protein [Bacteroidales bacterium]